jgi:hypothetical protein
VQTGSKTARHSQGAYYRVAGLAAFLGGPSTSDLRAKNAVYVVTVPETFRPQRPWDLPPQTSDGELWAKNVTLSEARDFVRVFNKRQLLRGLTDHKWAMAIKHVRCRWSLTDEPMPGEQGFPLFAVAFTIQQDSPPRAGKVGGP